jgi:4-hydroxybenzoate polyprenyltransferase
MRTPGDWRPVLWYLFSAAAMAVFLVSGGMPDWRVAGWIIVGVAVACALSYVFRRPAKP